MFNKMRSDIFDFKKKFKFILLCGTNKIKGYYDKKKDLLDFSYSGITFSRSISIIPNTSPKFKSTKLIHWMYTVKN